MTRTQRLILRPYAESDLAAVHAYGSDPEVTHHVPCGPNSEEETRAFIRKSILGAEAEPRLGPRVARYRSGR